MVVTGPAREIELADEAATHRFGRDLALALRPGDVIALDGDLGTGKTTLARAVIRALAGNPDLDVPSPSYTLVQTYGGPLPVAHADLYRLGDPSEVEELGLAEAATDGVVLVEWPSRGGGRLPPFAVTIALSQAGGDRRRARISGMPDAAGRIVRSLEARFFLDGIGRPDAVRTRLAGDASARRYEIVSRPASPDRILMDSPPLVLGPPVRDGKAYAEIAHTSRTVAAFVAVANALRERGIVTPEILGMDLDRGFLLLQHLGSGSFLDAHGDPVTERYEAAARLLARIHAAPWNPRLPVTDDHVHEVPPFDRPALMIEVDLLLDWYVPWKMGSAPDAAMRRSFAAAWTTVFDRLDTAETSLVLRDYHSPNIVWRPGRLGSDRLGLLDFQDALIGPAAYDVASLGMDARVTIPPGIEAAATAAYVEARREDGPFDEAGFREAYAITAAQRNSKILGIFVRLKERDGKPAYLAHLPRIRAYLRRALTHPTLAPVADFYATHRLLAEES